MGGHPQAQDLQDASATGFQNAGGIIMPAAQGWNPSGGIILPAAQGWDSPQGIIMPPAKRARTDTMQLTTQQVWTDSSISTGERHIGVIKKFWPDNKYGFIECPELQASFGGDVFLSDKQVGHYQNGSTVSFRYDMKNGKPQAYDLADP